MNLADLLRLQGKRRRGRAASCGGRCRWTRRTPRCTTRSASCSCAASARREALAELAPRRRARRPGRPDFAYAYAIGLHSAGRADEALAVLRAAQKRSPGARGLLVALVTIHRERGALREARAWARKLVEAAPGDPSARALAASLEPAGARARAR